ncbi:MAG: hypothetical protein PHS47_03115 [Methanocellales archaeon]|nr:hypothetical protein [Methanocellales archaeon]
MGYLDEPENIKKLRRVFYTCLVILFLIDLIVPKHHYFSLERVPGFYAIYGFVACVSLVFMAKLLRKFIKRGEDYYDY